MDLRWTKEELAFRDEVREFCRVTHPEIQKKVRLGQELHREEYKAWQRALDAKGWAVPLWPVEYGGTGWDAARLFIFNEELQKAPALLPDTHNSTQVGPVIIAFGTEEQKKKFLPRIRNLDWWFAQGFSEPGSGSDLASLKTRADRDGDHYVVNGSKIWTTHGHMSDWMFALVRTDPNAKKQSGISYLLLDLSSPGVTIRPIITIDSNHHINQVFFDNVRVPIENRIGEENKGWGYAKYLMGNSRTTVARIGLSKGRVGYIKELAKTVMEDGRPLSEHTRFREKLALLETEIKAIEITSMRMVADRMKKAEVKQDPRSSVLKLKGSELYQAITEVLLETAGPQAIPKQLEFLKGETDISDGPDWCATAAPHYFMNRSRTIAGGTSEVQHTVVAKRILGL